MTILERLKQLQAVCELSVSDKEDFSYYLRQAYPKLLAVVEAASELDSMKILSTGRNHREQLLFKALAALEEDV